MTQTKSMPKANDWNNYWSDDQTQRFTKVSFSKRRILRILEPYLMPGNKVLDAGCGSGFFSREFCNRGLETISLDYSHEALAVAEELTDGQSQLVQADLLQDPLSSKISSRMDLIFTDGLFEHFDDQQQNAIMQNLMSVLSDDGIIATFVPNKYSPWELIRPIYMPGIEEDPFTMKQLLNLNQRNDLNVLNHNGINVLPIALSPDSALGQWFGMLLFTLSCKKHISFQ